MDRNIEIVRQLEQVFQPHWTMFEDFKEEKNSLQYNASAKKRQTLKNTETSFFVGEAFDYSWILLFVRGEGGLGMRRSV